jgi:hypothetical protein
MSDLSEYFLKSKSSVVQLELLEISHPDFSKVFRVVRNALKGVTVTLEDLTVATFEFYPIRITATGVHSDLDNALRIDFGDLGDVLPDELDRVQTANGFSTKPTVIYRTYRSDILTQPLFGPIQLQIKDISFNREGASFEAKAPSLNVNRTGQTYTYERFPMLKGFL